MPVIYDGNELRPTPTVDFNIVEQSLSDGRRLGTVITATLTGSIVAQKTGDTVTPLGIEARLSTILEKQTALRAIFAVDGALFEVQGLDGSDPVKFNAKVKSIDFSQGIWVDRSDYTIVLEGEDFAGEGLTDPHITDASESWSFEEAEAPHTYQVNHQISATGRTIFNADGTIYKFGWEVAKDFVKTKLGIDWTTTNAIWSPKSGADIADESEVQLDATTQYNHIISEDVNEAEGTYQVAESWVLAQANYTETFTVATRRVADEPNATTYVSIQGSIQGLYVNLHDVEAKLVNAKARWLTVESLLYTRAAAYSGSATLNTHPTTANVDYDTIGGSVNYSYEFNDRVLVADTYETYSVSVSTSAEDGTVTVSVDGNIVGQLYPDDAPDPDLKYARALSRWNTVKLLLFSRATTESVVGDLKAFPTQASMNPNPVEGTISYSFQYSNRTPESVKYEYNVSRRYSREDAREIVTVTGTVTGLRSASPTNPFTNNNLLERYNTARSYFQGIEPNLLGLAANYVDVSKVNPVPYTYEVSHLPPQGQVTFSYEYNSTPTTCVPNSLSEIVTITDDAATPLIAIFPIPGREAGPIIQDINTVKEKRRSVTIEVVMPVTKDTNVCAGTEAAPNVTVTQYAPTGSIVRIESDQTTWSPSTGRYSRTVSWVYQ